MTDQRTPQDAIATAGAGTVVVEGRTVRWTSAGRDRPDRPPVVLVHGTGGDTRTHFPFLLPVLGEDQLVLSVDLDTPDPAPRAAEDEGRAARRVLEALADQVSAVVETVLPGRAVTVAGYSLGAVVAVVVAARHHELAARLVLMAGWLRTDRNQLLRNDSWHALLPDPRGHAAFSTYCAFSPEFLARLPAAALAELLGSPAPDEATRRQMRLNRLVDVTDLAPAIRCPTLLVAGEQDAMVPDHHAQELLGAIHDARLARIAGGHGMVAERPAELVSLLNAFNADPGRHPAGSLVPRHRP